MTRWQRYWFSPGGRTSAAVLRIAVGASVLWMLYRLRGGYTPETAPHHAYHPVGILRLVPGEPTAAMAAVVWPIAYAATIAMILGVWSRAATALSFAASLAIASYEYSFAPSWSHDNNAPLIAQLALLGAHGGDALSLDALWRRRRGRPAPHRPYLWSVRLVQLAIAVMMASAAASKLLSGGVQLAWVLSDNLRNQILVRFDLNELPRTALAEWLIASPWRWKLAAFLNICAQLAPLAACLAIRRPLLRAALGSLFAVEVLGLCYVMGFQNFHWLPLTAAFVDWDRLAAVVRRRRVPSAPAVLVPPSRASRIFVVSFVVADSIIAFWRWPSLDQRLGTYPISSFPMFSGVRANPPYDDHRPYELFSWRYEVGSDPSPNPSMQGWLARTGNLASRKLAALRSPDAVRSELSSFLADAARYYPDHAVHSARISLVSLQARPYPEPPRFVRVEVATLGELTSTGAFRSALSELSALSAPLPTGARLSITLPPSSPSGPFASYLDGTLTDLSATPDGPSRWLVSPPPARSHLVLRDGPRLWLITTPGR